MDTVQEKKVRIDFTESMTVKQIPEEEREQTGAYLRKKHSRKKKQQKQKHQGGHLLSMIEE